MKLYYFGGNGGHKSAVSVVPTKISMRCGDYVDRLDINGEQIGGSGGGQTRTVALDNYSTFIRDIEYYVGTYNEWHIIQYLKFHFSDGTTLEGGPRPAEDAVKSVAAKTGLDANKMRVYVMTAHGGDLLDSLGVIAGEYEK